jgi:pimeloyl-ACP methyl ester carboxylesterase
MPIHALLVGINSYLNDAIRPLNGCKNDVSLMQETLQTRFLVDEDNIQILTNRSAKKANIIAGFQNHLSQAGKGDTALFYFSGHGSQEPAPKQFWKIDIDRQLETLVCHDSRAGQVTDLADKELRYLIAQLSNEGVEVVVIIDSCHSGHASRIIDDDDSNTRQTTAQTTPRTLQQFTFYDDAVQQGWINHLATIPQGKHILLSACRDIELSKEKNINGQCNGIFTYSLCSQLNSQSNTLSYHNLLMRVRALTHKANTQQTPQIEAILDVNTQQPFLGTEIIPLEMITSFKDGHWELDAGLVHGIRVGDEVALRDNSGDDPDFLLLIAQVSKVFTGKSILIASTNRHTTLLKNLTGLDQVNGLYSSSISHHSIEKLRFSLEGDEAGMPFIRESIKTLSKINRPSDFIVEIQGDAIQQGVDYRLRAQNGRYMISEAENTKFRPLFDSITGLAGKYDKSAADEVLSQLEHLKRWKQKLELDNRGSLAQHIDMDAVQLVVTHQEQELIDSDVNLRYDYNKENPKPRISLSVRYNPNKSIKDVTLYCALLLFDAADASVTSLLDNDAKLFSPHNNTLLFKEGRDFPVQVKQQLFNNGICETEDFLKLIISDSPFDAKLLSQEGLDIFKGGNKNIPSHGNFRGVHNLLNLFEQELHFTHTRSFELNEEPLIPLWLTKTIKIITTRLPESVEIIPRKVTTVTTGVLIKPHPTFSATVRVGTLEDTLRSVDGSQQNTNIIPPIFRDDGLTPPLSFSTSRNIATDLTTLELQVDPSKNAASGGIGSITTEHPLIITLGQTLQRNETILAYSYDGECYLPLGISRNNSQQSAYTQIMLDRLPNPVIADGDSDEVDRGLFGSIKILFQKILHHKFDLFQDPTRLAQPLFKHKNDLRKVTSYQDNPHALAETIEQSDKILLILHGIIGTSRSMAGFSQVVLDETSLAAQYDCILTFDYENLNEPIQKTAEILKRKLAAIGLDADHGKQLDVVAHSMGGLVSRCFIECNQGDEIVNKLVMLGTPNGGTPIAQHLSNGIHSVSDWANNTLAAIINGYISNGLGAVAVSGLVKMLNISSKTLGQMHPESDLLLMLEKSKQTSIPYYHIVGNTDFLLASSEENIEAEFIQRMSKKLKLFSYQQLTTWLYKAPNDIAVSIESMQHLPSNWQYQAQLQLVACNHLSYFDNEEVLRCLMDILVVNDT